jgi:malonyl-CoA O-methyltransferase
VDKKVIARNFSRCAFFYDQYANIQRRVAADLLKGIKEKRPSRILEIGCGTGNYTLLLKNKYKDSVLKAIDISQEMINVARDKLKASGIEFIVTDAEKYDLDESFDLITSNACFQWFADLGESLLKYKGLLNKNGTLSFSIFGPLTFWELDSSLRDISKRVSVEAARFRPLNQIKKLFQLNFKKIEIKEKSYEETLPNLMALLNKIKYTGIRGGSLGGEIFFSPRFLKKLEQVYLTKFGRIKATYQVFFCYGKKE